MAGAPLASTAGSSPQRCSWTTPGRAIWWVETVSAGNVVRSTRATSCPRRASSSAVAAPAARAPTTATSWRWRWVGMVRDSGSAGRRLARRSGGPGGGEPRSPAADRPAALVVEKVHNGLLDQPVFVERLDLGPGEWPWQLAGILVLVARPPDDQQPAAGCDQPGEPGEGGAPRRAGEHLQREHLDDQIERAGPGPRRGQQIGGQVLHGGAGKAPPRGGDRGRRHVEGHRGEAQRGDVFGIVAQTAADHEYAPAPGQTGQRRDHSWVGSEVRPRHGGGALLGGRIQRLEPAGGLTAGDRIRGEPARVAAVRIGHRGHGGRWRGMVHDYATSSIERPNVTASRIIAGAVERRAASGRRPRASLTVENARRNATNTVIVKICESLNPAARSSCTSAAVVPFGSRATLRAHAARARSLVLRPSSTPANTRAAVCASLALASLLPHAS